MKERADIGVRLFTDQGMPKTARKPADARTVAWNRLSPPASEGTNPCQHLDLRLVASRDSNCPGCKSHCLWNLLYKK